MLEKILEEIINFFNNESILFGGESAGHVLAIGSTLLTCIYYFSYYYFSVIVRNKIIIRNYEIEKIAFKKEIITNDQLMVKYTANLSASSTMAALSVTMVLLSVAALFENKLTAYNHFISVIVCALMTIASSVLLFAHELYDAIINPIFNPARKFKLRQLGANFQALGLILFIVSMLLAISTVSVFATMISSFFCCIVMTVYIEKRLTDKDKKDEEIDAILRYFIRKNVHENLQGRDS
ncbi:MAG: hypothetical protein HQL81_09635 [Magnetococcales bacterium]|nr:hypothetical protein [Magnetococcales bacterium]